MHLSGARNKTFFPCISWKQNRRDKDLGLTGALCRFGPVLRENLGCIDTESRRSRVAPLRLRTINAVAGLSNYSDCMEENSAAIVSLAGISDRG